MIVFFLFPLLFCSSPFPRMRSITRVCKLHRTMMVPVAETVNKYKLGHAAFLNCWWWEQKKKTGGWEDLSKWSKVEYCFLSLRRGPSVPRFKLTFHDLDLLDKCMAHRRAANFFWCLLGRGLLVADTVSSFGFIFSRWNWLLPDQPCLSTRHLSLIYQN